MSGVFGKEISCHFGSVKKTASRLLTYVIDSTFQPDDRKNKEILDGLISKCLFFTQSDRFVLSGHAGFEERRLLWVEMWAAAKSLLRCRSPIKHFVFSFKDRVLSSQEFGIASQLVAETLGVGSCLWVAAAHRDTQNFHIHFVVVTEKLDQAGHQKVTINGRRTNMAAQKVCARLCYELQILPCENSMLEYRPREIFDTPIYGLKNGHFFIRQEYKPSRPLVYREDGEQKTLPRTLKPSAPILDRLLQYELRTGRKSNQRVFQEILIPCLDRLVAYKASWQEVHLAFNKVGFDVHRTENGGGVVSYGTARLKLSSLGAQYSMRKLESAFGTFEAPSRFSLNSCIDYGVPILPKVHCLEFYEYQNFLAIRERVDQLKVNSEIPKQISKSFEEFKLTHATSSVRFEPKTKDYKRPLAQWLSEDVACMRKGDDLVYLDMSGGWPEPIFVDKGNGLYFTRKDQPSLTQGLRLAFKKWLGAPVRLVYAERLKPYLLSLIEKIWQTKVSAAIAAPTGKVMETGSVSEKTTFGMKTLSAEKTPVSQNNFNSPSVEVLGGTNAIDATYVLSTPVASEALSKSQIPDISGVNIVYKKKEAQEHSDFDNETSDDDESDDNDSGYGFSI